jgi:hypothetical protein
MNFDDFNKMFGNGGLKIFIIYFSYLLYFGSCE